MTKETDYQHQSVMLNEAVDALAIKAEGTYIDATFGRGGHAVKLLEQLSEKGNLMVIDKDPQAIKKAQSLFTDDVRVCIKQGSFADVQRFFNEESWDQCDGFFLDLGVSSPQLDDAERGFSFQKEGPLDMRMNPHEGQSVAQWLAHATHKEIAHVLWVYGEERFSRRIATAIVETRDETPVLTTTKLAQLIASVVPTRERKKNPATRSFQALRIFINRELDDITACLQVAVGLLKPKGRLVVISFHSLEDRIVKRFIRDHSRAKSLPKDLPVRECDIYVDFKSLGKRKASKDEVEKNVRSRSAVMRVAEKV
ncbi:16S rRNA (cytosine(1402)-N(4))-methyltransferase [hydrothermal vent metagenome]|uniref:16S rRNA (Cytosine(1402)-N(4))-methyltransferase n=1 Tax=hydrothermal vent metagenome TaxID=652676 RepID=A0A3B0YZC8_9ZZZZ